MCMSEMPRGVHFGECKGKRRNWTRAGRTPRPCNRGLWVGSEKLEPTSAKGWMQFSPRRAVPGGGWPWRLGGHLGGCEESPCETGRGLSQSHEKGKVGVGLGTISQVADGMKSRC